MARRFNLRPFGVVGGFALPVILSAVVGVVTVPVLIAGIGQEQWGLIYLAQTVGQIGGVAVAFGWGATGPATVASTPTGSRAPLYRQSVVIRCVLFVLVAPLAIGAMLLLTRGDVAVAVLGGIVYLVPLLGGGWFFIGEGRPLRLLLFDALPGIAGTIGGSVAAAVTHDIQVFLVCQGAGYVVAVVLAALSIHLGRDRHAAGSVVLKSWRDTLRDQRSAVVTSATSTLYAGLPVIAVTWFVPTLQSTFSLAHLLFRYCTIAFTPIQQFFQGWVPAIPERLPHRVRVAAVAASAVSAVGGVLLAVLGPIAASLLSAGDSTRSAGVTFALSLPFGVAIAAVCSSAVIGLACLVALGRTADVAVSTVVGAVVGAPLILLAAWSGQLALVAWAFAASEIAVTTVQIVALRRRLRDRAHIEAAAAQDGGASAAR